MRQIIDFFRSQRVDCIENDFYSFQAIQHFKNWILLIKMFVTFLGCENVCPLKLLISLISLSKFQMHTRIGSVPWEWCQAIRFCSVAAEGAFWNSGMWILLCQLERWRVMIVLSMPYVLIPPTFLLQLSKFFLCDFFPMLATCVQI